MTKLIEVDERGALHVPKELLGGAEPRTVYQVDRVGDTLVLRRAGSLADAYWSSATPEERIDAFNRWVDSHTTGPGLSDKAISRDSIYD